ncbi:dolichyl-phosphate mannose synthase, partial [Candidatus Kuenenbacteria bacterium CG_4_9_14_3_um_filter_39_14]
MKTTAVVPVYNENPDKLNSFLNELKSYVDDIVVVDDGSLAAISNFQFPISNLSLLRHELNRGQGAALQTGTDYAIKHGARIIVHIDGDGQHKPENIPSLINP